MSLISRNKVWNYSKINIKFRSSDVYPYPEQCTVNPFFQHLPLFYFSQRLSRGQISNMILFNYFLSTFHFPISFNQFDLFNWERFWNLSAMKIFLVWFLSFNILLLRFTLAIPFTLWWNFIFVIFELFIMRCTFSWLASLFRHFSFIRLFLWRNRCQLFQRFRHPCWSTLI